MVSLERQPYFSSFFEAEKPGVPRSTTKAVMPRWAGTSRLVRASTTQNPPTEPCVMNILVPFKSHPSPSRTATVFIPALSDPLPGSVSAHAASHSPLAALGKYLRFCSSLPKLRMWLVPSPLWLATVSAKEPSTRAHSSTQMAYARVSIPAPPYSSGMRIPSKPRAASLGTISWGNRSSASHSRA